MLHHGMAVAVLAVFLQAPFVHTHGATAGHVHWDDLLHLHSMHSSAEDVALDAPDHCSNARFHDWVSSKAEVRVQLVANHCTPLPFPSLESRTVPLTWKLLHAHDPPWRLNLSPRAPPL
jgi:hypothetical protein